MRINPSGGSVMDVVKRRGEGEDSHLNLASQDGTLDRADIGSLSLQGEGIVPPVRLLRRPMDNSALAIGEYVAAVEACKASTVKRRLLDSLILREGVSEGIREFLSRQSLFAAYLHEAANRHVESMASLTDLGVISVRDSRYPYLLKRIPSPPAFLFYRGNIEILNNRCIAVVGTRRASDSGLDLARRMGTDLASQEITVVSGLARGIDRESHIGALSILNGQTAAVLGTPVNRAYPAEHAELQETIARRGVVLSHFPVGMPVTRFNFPERNRIMSGLCEATVVIEAGDTSGAVIQARQCLSQGRRLFITNIVKKDPSLRWAKFYLDRGGQIADSAADILAALDET